MAVRIDLEPFLLSVSRSCLKFPDNPYPANFVIETPVGPIECPGFAYVPISDPVGYEWDIELNTSNAPTE